MRETWYVLEDGNVVDPTDVVIDEGGKLSTKEGIFVAMRGDAHMSRSVDVEVERAKAEGGKGKPSVRPEGNKAATREMTGSSSPKAKYQTR